MVSNMETRLGNIAKIFTGKCNAQDAVEDGMYPLFDRSGEVKKSNSYFADCEAIIVLEKAQLLYLAITKENLICTSEPIVLTLTPM